MLTVWLAGHPQLAQTLDRVPYAALASRIQVRIRLARVLERERFTALILHALKSAGCQHTLLSDSGLELLRHASKGSLLFQPDLSDEAAAALRQFVTALSSLMARRYGRQISHSRHYPPQAQKEPF